MKQIDSFKIAVHNLWNNKSRTVLTVIIVTVVSTLIMALLLIGIAFAQNQVAVNRLVFDETGTTYRLSSRTVSKSGSGGSSYRYQNFGITAEEYDSFNEIADRHKSVIAERITTFARPQTDNSFDSYSEFKVLFLYGTDPDTEFTAEAANTYYSEPFSHYEVAGRDLSYAPAVENALRSGRIWSAADNDKRFVWISDNTLRTLTQNGVEIEVGDEFPIVVVHDTNILSATYTLAGVYQSDALFPETDSWSRSDSGYILGEKAFEKDFSSVCSISEISLSYRPPEADYDYNKVYKEMKAFTDEVNDAMEPSSYTNEDGTDYNDRFYCDFVDQMQMVVLMSALIVGLVAILALIVLLLSIGSVANTIIISVDKDRKFIGLMKAVGLNQRGVKRIVTYQSLLQIVLGVLIGVGALFLLRPFVLTIMTSIFSSMFSGFGIEYTVAVSVPFYLPIITVAVFFLFAMLFSRSALTKIARQDVMTTISEVA